MLSITYITILVSLWYECVKVNVGSFSIIDLHLNQVMHCATSSLKICSYNKPNSVFSKPKAVAVAGRSVMLSWHTHPLHTVHYLLCISDVDRYRPARTTTPDFVNLEFVRRTCTSIWTIFIWTIIPRWYCYIRKNDSLNI